MCCCTFSALECTGDRDLDERAVCSSALPWRPHLHSWVFRRGHSCAAGTQPHWGASSVRTSISSCLQKTVRARDYRARGSQKLALSPHGCWGDVYVPRRLFGKGNVPTLSLVKWQDKAEFCCSAYILIDFCVCEHLH